MGKVYVVQVPKRYDKEAGKLVKTVDISSAAEFGELTEPLFPHDSGRYYKQVDVYEIRKRLKDYGDDDSILAVGDPAAIGLSIALAAENNRGKVSILRWDKRQRAYLQLKFDVRG